MVNTVRYIGVAVALIGAFVTDDTLRATNGLVSRHWLLLRSLDACSGERHAVFGQHPLFAACRARRIGTSGGADYPLSGRCGLRNGYGCRLEPFRTRVVGRCRVAGASSPVRNWARPYPNDQSSASFPQMAAIRSAGSRPQSRERLRASRA
jgi:hypothetical protein